MGGCAAKSFTVNKANDIRFTNIQPFLFSITDAENVLVEAEPGDYLLYKDYDSDRIILSFRHYSYIRHCRITVLHDLYYMDGQPYAYLDSIVLYHRKHKLNGVKLNKQAHLSARVVKSFAHKLARSNGNLHLYMNKNNTSLESPPTALSKSNLSSTGHSRTSSNASLLTSSTNSTQKQHRL